MYEWYERTNDMYLTLYKNVITLSKISNKKTQLMTYIAADYHARAENVLDSCWRDVQF